MTDFLKRHWLSLSAIAVTVLVSAYAWPRVAEPLPVHWGLSGEPDRFSSRLEALGVMPLVALGLFLLLTFLPRLDRNTGRNARVLDVVRTVTLLGLAALHIGIVTGYLGLVVNIVRLAGLIVGVILIATGNILPKTQPSAFVGIRLPWTLTSKKSWRWSQRAGGWLLALTGLAMVASSLVWGTGWALLAVIAAMLLGLVLIGYYSYLVWRADDERERAL